MRRMAYRTSVCEPRTCKHVQGPRAIPNIVGAAAVCVLLLELLLLLLLLVVVLLLLLLLVLLLLLLLSLSLSLSLSLVWMVGKWSEWCQGCFREFLACVVAPWGALGGP